jgi:uncharacterized membrane protein YecN with MAPEG domain
MVQVHNALLYSAILSVIYVVLSIRVISGRLKNRVLLGDGANQSLSVAIRTHANFSEYVPLTLILIWGIEALNYPTYAVHILGGGLVLARLSHIHGMNTKKSLGPGRPIGTILTLSILIFSSFLILLKTLS